MTPTKLVPAEATAEMIKAAYEAVSMDDRWAIDDSDRWAKSYRAALDAAPDVSRWPQPRPMSEAPRDGTHILVHQGDEFAVAAWMTAVEDNSGDWIIYRQLSYAEGGAMAIRMPDPTGWWPLPTINPETRE